jgi:hypothetical protein
MMPAVVDRFPPHGTTFEPTLHGSPAALGPKLLSWLSLLTANGRSRARHSAAASVRANVRERVRLALNPAGMHVFDRESEAAIQRYGKRTEAGAGERAALIGGKYR